MTAGRNAAGEVDPGQGRQGSGRREVARVARGGQVAGQRRAVGHRHGLGPSGKKTSVPSRIARPIQTASAGSLRSSTTRLSS